MSENGDLSYFVTTDALVAEDTDGVNDVYEQALPDGKPKLVSGGDSIDERLSHGAMSQRRVA